MSWSVIRRVADGVAVGVRICPSFFDFVSFYYVLLCFASISSSQFYVFFVLLQFALFSSIMFCVVPFPFTLICLATCRCFFFGWPCFALLFRLDLFHFILSCFAPLCFIRLCCVAVGAIFSLFRSVLFLVGFASFT